MEEGTDQQISNVLSVERLPMTITVGTVWHHPVTLNTLVVLSNSALERSSPSELNSSAHLMEWLSEVQRRYYMWKCEWLWWEEFYTIENVRGKHFLKISSWVLSRISGFRDPGQLLIKSKKYQGSQFLHYKMG